MIKLRHMQELTKTAACLLRRGGSSHDWESIQQAIEEKRAQLFFVNNGSYLVLQVERNDLFILAAAGVQGDLLMELCRQVAKQNDCKTISFNTSKKGLPRLLKHWNPVEVQRTYRINVDENLH